MSPPRQPLVLAIYPITRGFAFVVFEGPSTPYDWGVFGVRGEKKNLRCVQRAAQLFAAFGPDTLVLQDMSERGTYRVERIRTLNEDIGLLAQTQGMQVFSYSRRHVRQFFTSPGTKELIAHEISKEIPAFSHLLPPKRRIWMSENPRMGIFDAAALAWVHYQAIN